VKKIDIKPMPGKALIQLKGFYENTGSIVIPENVAVRRKCEAKLLAFTQSMKEKERVDLQDAMKADAVIVLKPYAGTQPFSRDGEDNLCIVRVSDIEAYSPEPIGAEHGEHSDGAVPRCHFCGPARANQSSNAMLMVQGPEGYYCPRCLKDKNGIVVDPDKVTLSEREERAMDRSIRGNIRA